MYCVYIFNIILFNKFYVNSNQMFVQVMKYQQRYVYMYVYRNRFIKVLERVEID